MAAAPADATLLAPWLAVRLAGRDLAHAEHPGRRSGQQLRSPKLHSAARLGPLGGALVHVLGHATRLRGGFTAGVWLDPFRESGQYPPSVPDTRVRDACWDVSHRDLLAALHIL